MFIVVAISLYLRFEWVFPRRSLLEFVPDFLDFWIGVCLGDFPKKYHRGTRQSKRLNSKGRAGRDGGRTGRGRGSFSDSKVTKNQTTTPQGKDSNVTKQGQKHREESSLAEKANTTQNNGENAQTETKELEKRRIEDGTVEWDDTKILRQTINRLRKGLADIDILEEKENVCLIRRYEKRYNDLMVVEINKI